MQLLTEVNAHDRLTRGHSERVRAYAELLGDELRLDEDDMNKLRWSALLHDVGKLGVPGEILNKAGRPTDEEWKILSDQPVGGGRMLEPLRDWLGDWVHSADQHHCRWDGAGYPSDLAGTEIALSGRIVGVADAFDVMTSARSYKKPLSAEVARQELTDCAGTQFDPAMVRAFLRVSLGQLRTVAGPSGWLANLLASAQAKVPIAATMSSGVTSATAGVVLQAVNDAPEAQNDRWQLTADSSAEIDVLINDEAPSPASAWHSTAAPLLPPAESAMDRPPTSTAPMASPT